jgi:hypothetical protein
MRLPDKVTVEMTKCGDRRRYLVPAHRDGRISAQPYKESISQGIVSQERARSLDRGMPAGVARTQCRAEHRFWRGLPAL